MRIVVVSTPVFKLGHAGLQGYGGLEQIAWQCAAGLAALGHEVKLIAPDGSICPNAVVVPVGPAGQVDEKTAYLKYWPTLLDADCIVDHSWMKWSYILKMEGRLKAPVLGVMHAPINSMYAELAPVEKGCWVCISEDQRAHFEALHGRAARVCYNGVDTEYYKPLNLPRNGRFLFLARFSTIKGPDLAITACKRMGVPLDLVGDNAITGEAAFFQQCAAQCDGQTIRMIGPATRSECVHWFGQSHVLLHPNQRFREPFGLAPVEAMLCGCPVIAWNNGAMRETVGPEVGWLVNSEGELADAVAQARSVSDRDMAVLRQRCREWAMQFSMENMVRNYELLCQTAVGTGGW